jgi:adenine-specific DNA methylase
VTQRRLIEEELPLKAVNAESAREKSLRHGHISTMHLWWARRPLSMSRAVVLGTLLPDPGDEVKRRDILNLIADASSFEASGRADRIGPLRQLLADAYPAGPPKVLDCFAGGGAIPLEALRLGCDTTAVDLNPVAYLIEKCVLEYPQRFGGTDNMGGNTLAQDFVKWAGWVRGRIEPRLAQVFPADANGKRPATYFWARTMICQEPRCQAELPLLSSFWLANSGRRSVWVDAAGTPGHIDLRVETGPPPAGADLSEGTVKASSITCASCGTSMPAKQVREYGKRKGFGRRLYAVLDVDGSGKRAYRSPSHGEIDGADRLASMLLQSLDEAPDGTSALPDEPCDLNGFRRVQSLVFGYETWSSLFNDRQLYVLGSLCEGVRAAHEEMLAEGMEAERALAVTTYLGFVVDKIADYNSSFTSWATTGEFLRSTFARQAIAMIWDYVETDPFHGGEGIWNAHVRWIELAIQHCSVAATQPATVQRGDAQHLPFADGTFDAVIVDPPYYDAIQYSYLSDFFFVWLKRSIGHLYPELFATVATPKKQEVIQNQAKPGSPEYVSDEEFDRRLQAALREIARVTKADGVISLVFAHTDVAAWERLLQGLRAARLVVSTSWPMRSEREGRSNATLQHAVLGSSVVLVCRYQETTQEGFYDDVVQALENRIVERLARFGEMGLVGADYFVSAIGPAFEVFAQYSRVVKLSGEEVGVSELMVLARQVVARHAMRRLLGTESLAALDAESLFYLTWRWAYVNAPVPADEAYKLERAFDVDLGHLCRAGGFARQAGANFILLAPHERKELKLGTSPVLIDVLHRACQLWDGGRRRQLEELLGSTGMGNEPAFWGMARALAEIVPDGSRERTMLLGLGGNRELLSEAAARSAARPEELTLFDSGGA